MACEVEHTDEFEAWWNGLSEAAQIAITAIAQLLAERGPTLPFPYSSGIEGSRHSHMRELRVQCQGDPIRILYAFNPIRRAILLIGGEKGGDDRFYEKLIPIADRLYDVHLREMREEGLIS